MVRLLWRVRAWAQGGGKSAQIFDHGPRVNEPAPSDDFLPLEMRSGGRDLFVVEDGDLVACGANNFSRQIVQPNRFIFEITFHHHAIPENGGAFVIRTARGVA